MTEYQPYGVRHFLRALDAEGASELRRRPIPLRSGAVLDKGAYADLAEFDPAAVRVYRTLVLRRSPLASRPPAAYRLVWSGRIYDVWQRSTASDPARLLSGRSLPIPPLRHPALIVGLGRVEHPSTWAVAAGALVLYPSGSGELRTSIRLTKGGCHSVWVGGSFRNRLTAVVDGRPVGSGIGQLNNAGQYTFLGGIALAAGAHVIELRYSGDVLAPGSGGPEYGLGPLVVTADASGRCGSTLD
jgi:hypothetical protein